MCCGRGSAELLIFAFILMCLTIPLQVFGRTLSDELKDFCSIMPTSQMKIIAESHIRSDKEFNEAVIFLQSNTWANMIRDVQVNPEWKKLKKFLNETGVNLDVMLKYLFDFVTDLKPTPNEKKTNRSLRSYFDDVEVILPIGKLLAMLHEKKQNSPAFKEFYNTLSAPNVHKMFENVRKQPEMRKVLIELKSMGARVDDIFELFYGFMNWDSPIPITKREAPNKRKSLREDFEDFKKLIPWDALRNISDEHLAHDKEYGEVVVYFQGPDFRRIISTIKVRREYQELKKYLEEAGIDVEAIISFFADILLNAKPGSKLEVTELNIRKRRSFRTYLDEIEAAIPVSKLLNLFNDKMENSEEFRKFVKKISEPKVKKMVEDIRALPETKELFNKLQSLGVRVRETLIILYAFLGWGSPFGKEFVRK